MGTLAVGRAECMRWRNVANTDGCHLHATNRAYFEEIQWSLMEALKPLVPEGASQVTTLPGESPRYEMADSAHHHHFRSNICLRVYVVPGCPGSLRRLAPRGFTVEHHDVTLYGRCRDCARRKRRASR